MDEFDRELRELTEGRAGEPLFLEPSAAERARAGGVEVKQAPAPPAGTEPRRSRRSRWLRADAGRRYGYLFAVAVLLLAGSVASLRVAHPNRVADGLPTAAGAASPTTASPRLATFSPASLLTDPTANPFLGTRADGWADGAAGIVAPAAKPAGRFTAAQVAAAYATTRKLLIAAGLDRQTLLGGTPAAFARLLTATQRVTFLTSLPKHGLAKDGSALSTRTWVISFAPGTTALVGKVIKVHGTMSAHAVTESGKPVLVVEVSYVFVYAVEPPNDPADWTRVAVREYGSVDFVPSSHQGRALGALEPRYRMVSQAAGQRCGVGDGYIYPDYPGDSSPGVKSAGLVISPYSTSRGAWPDLVCGRDGI
ncbi:MAG TPA: hypothetical protein VH589_15630 [Trebonia sp.]|jgi:hypothetical protein